MNNSAKPADADELRQLWRRWTRVVTRCAGARSGRLPVSPAGYHALHTALLAACRSQATHSDANGQPVFQKLEALLHPWVSLEVLAGTNKHLLQDLLARCLAVERQLGVGGSSGAGRRALAWGLAGLAMATLVGVLAVSLTSGSESHTLDSLAQEARSLSDQFRRAVQAASLSTKLGVLTAVLVGLGLRLLFTMRKY
jgi:hypothetical protein